MAASESSGEDYYDRFDNAEFAREEHQRRERIQREQQEERVELYGKAAELFQSRYLDTFEVERHDVEIKFYRPVGANHATDLDEIAEDDPDLADRLERGSRLLAEFEQRQQQVVLSAQSDEEFDLESLLDDALDGTTLMRRALSAHAVDESFHDPAVWTAIFRRDDHIGEVFQDFFDEGDTGRMQRQLNELQKVTSANQSQD